MFLWRLFITDPMMGFALSICLATIFWCIAILHKRQKGPERSLAALIGIIAVWQGLQLLRQSGVLAVPGTNRLPGFAEFTVTALCMVSLVVLRVSMTERKSTNLRLRIVEANGPAKIDRPLPSADKQASVSELILDANPLATVAMDRAGSITYWNGAAQRLLGWNTSEMVGQSGSWLLEAPVHSKTGKLLTLETWISTLHDHAGRPCGTVVMLAAPAMAVRMRPEPCVAEFQSTPGLQSA